MIVLYLYDVCSLTIIIIALKKMNQHQQTNLHIQIDYVVARGKEGSQSM